MTPPYLVAGTLLLLLMASPTGTGKFQVIGPKGPVIAVLGENAELPCHLSPSMDVQKMEVRYHRNNPFGLVYRYKNFQDHVEQGMPQYRGRTEFLRDNITKGHVALKILSIQLSDGGEYSCSFENSTYINAVQFQVLVTESGTAPHIHIDHGETKGLKLTCTSTGWYPEPEVQWRDLQGQHFSPASEKKTPERSGLFHVESSIILDESSERNVACYIRNPVLSVEKEVHISVTDALFPRVSPWPVVVPVIVVLLIIIGIICVLLMRARKSKDALKLQNGSLERQYDSLKLQYEAIVEEKDKISEELDRRKLVGKEGLNEVQRHAEKQNVPDNDARFDTLVAVLGQNIFSGGQHYWEVDVAGKDRWTIGLCWDSVPRKGQYISAHPDHGFWTLCLKSGVCQALSTPRYILNVPEPLSTVGIFLNYDEGLVTFYNVTEFTILYTFKSKFTKPMKPYLYPGPSSPGNRNDLTIIKVSVTNSDDSAESTAETHSSRARHKVNENV
ncbi:butyrophilin subfamily 1 member A1-like isoform X2 [Dasypus novemcinctus]|uniref:butyrophilin subfamily 1 member A1-like isoform X2 n=1 Tax=Dasypus novemcinctus TaxID=9361 RepID=UPI00265E932A|nr:butyrophilin subfamily 1 member A1-like isoform X2 [Dasypus novemcinctus]